MSSMICWAWLMRSLPVSSMSGSSTSVAAHRVGATCLVSDVTYSTEIQRNVIAHRVPRLP